MNSPTGLSITNPLVLYRSLIATNRIRPDPAQLRLALHLQKLYEGLKDYEPAVEYKQRLNRLNQTLGVNHEEKIPEKTPSIGSRGIWTSLLAEKEKRDSLALTRVLTSHDEAMQLASPKGLMLHGEVGTGKSMLIDLFADSLPTTKKKRWHFNTFILETFSRLEQLRRNRLSQSGALAGDEHSLLWLARDLIKTSPILFLDEFQLPDRTSSKIMTNLMTSFFQLGGVLIATSNRMPDELAKAAGMEFVKPSISRRFGWRFGVGSNGNTSSQLFGGTGEFAQFLELLKARCDVWEMDGGNDYRRSESGALELLNDAGKSSLDNELSGTLVERSEVLAGHAEGTEFNTASQPPHYFIVTSDTTESEFADFKTAQLQAVGQDTTATSANIIPWTTSTLKVYGRSVFIPHTYNGVASFTFSELCVNQLGPADYISLSSTFHTFIITEVPILTTLLKNEARRFITLLDALYEARCKLLVSAAAGPDDLFFPETRRLSDESAVSTEQDAVYSETFSDMHQDLTAPFRPNVSSYQGDTGIDRTHSRLQGLLADDALEDDPPNRARRMGGFSSSEAFEQEREEARLSPNFAQLSTFIGEDEKFAYKRATSRLWEMCGKKWWEREEEGWWRPLPREARRWEGSMGEVLDRAVEAAGERDGVGGSVGEGMGSAREVDEKQDEVMFKHGASPFRTASEPPPKIGWTHVWGTTKWGKRAGAWGQGPEGLKERKKGGNE